MKQPDAKKLDAHELRRVSVIAECDPRSVRRYLAGKRMQTLVQRRIERALRKLGEGQP